MKISGSISGIVRKLRLRQNNDFLIKKTCIGSTQTAVTIRGIPISDFSFEVFQGHGVFIWE